MQQAPEDIKRLSKLMDSEFGAPGGFRFGWDGLLGLIPFVGDLVTNGASLYIVLRAAGLGCPPSVLLRMGLNLFIDNLLDVIPLLGNILDFVWRANNKNVALLESYLKAPDRTVRSSRVVVWFTVFLLIAMMGLFVVGAFFLAKWLFSLVPEFSSSTHWDA
jgi:hypothetical protein